MGYYCINGSRECFCCMDCKPDPELVHCPMCGAWLDRDCTIYYHRESDEILGCESCIGTKQADALMDEL